MNRNPLEPSLQSCTAFAAARRTIASVVALALLGLAGSQINAAPTTEYFYGVNCHYAYGWNHYGAVAPADLIAQVQSTGLNIIRDNCSSSTQLTRFKQLAQAAQGTAVQVYPVLTNSVQADESSSYTASYNNAQTMATSLVGLVHYYEIGNEWENSVSGLFLGGNGDLPSQYSNSVFIRVRGAVRGLIDGVKSVDPNAVIVSPTGGWLHYGLLQMLWNGTQPDGTSGHSVARWDVTAWHWYSDMNDIENAGNIHANVLQVLKTSFGKPIWLTEFGVRPNYGDGSEAQKSAFLTGSLGYSKWVSVASTYNIQSVLNYEFYDDTSEIGYGLYNLDGVTPKQRWTDVHNFIIAHPAPFTVETESLDVAATSGDTHRIFASPQFSGGYGTILDANAVGDYVTYVLPNGVPGTYNVRVGVKKASTRGIFQMAIGIAGNPSLTNIGSPQDLYAPSDTFTELNIGTWTPGTTSDKWIRFTIVGKNGSSTGFSEAFDYIRIIPQ